MLFALAGLFFVKWFLGIRRLFNNAFSAWSDVGEVAYVFDFDGVSVTHAKGFRNYEWPALTTFNDYPSSIVLNHYENAALSIPKRCLQDGESETLYKFLKQSRNLTQEEGRRQAWRHRIIWGIVIVLLVVLLLMVVFALNMEQILEWVLKDGE